MKVKKICRIAEYSFEIVFNDTMLWEEMSEMHPFVVASDNISLFSVSLSNQLLLPPKPLLTKVNGKEQTEYLYRTGVGYLYECHSLLKNYPSFQIQMSDDFEKATICINKDVSNIHVAFCQAIKIVYGMNIRKQNAFSFHASCVIKEGKAILFHAPSGTGKSTHSLQWMKAFPDTELLNDDHPIVRIWPDGRVIAYGSPWSGKTPCYKNLSAPVAAFVRINRAKENKIHRLRPVEAYASLMPSCTSKVKWNPEITEAQHQTLEKIISSVPCYQLDCLPNEDAARVCAAEVLKNL